jgi:hypothetical protein
VVTLLNVHKPRDRSHYEQFAGWHASFYQAVEATSVTPFAPRALDRALPAALVAMCRHGNETMTPPSGASHILTDRESLRPFALRLAERARNHTFPPEQRPGGDIGDHVRDRAESLLDDWLLIARELQSRGVSLQYQNEEIGAGSRLLRDPLDPELANLREERTHFKAARSMRDVEAGVDLVVKPLNDWSDQK